jgi:hypothetical protein
MRAGQGPCASCEQSVNAGYRMAPTMNRLPPWCRSGASNCREHGTGHVDCTPLISEEPDWSASCAIHARSIGKSG